MMRTGLTAPATCGEPFDHVAHLYRPMMPTGDRTREWHTCDGTTQED